MVSFSCENCGDVLTKKKLDPHRNQCRGASYTCLDCMVHFHGTEYRTHTSCISEAQKYQGSTYKEKKGKHSRNNSRTDLNAQALVPRQPYVQDEIDETNGTIAVVDAPPRAPTPPQMVNVFDFLVQDETPNASRFDLSAPEESHMITDGREEYDEDRDHQALVPRGYHTEERTPGQYNSQDHFAEEGFSYGHAPVQPSLNRFDSTGDMLPPSANYKTPAPKAHRDTAQRNLESTVSKKKSGSEKKRKRSPSNIDMSLVHAQAQAERDAVMTDAPPVLHSGLTGGLNRLLRSSEFPPSPEFSGGDWVDASPLSPAKRSKQAHVDRERGRDREPKSRKSSNTTVTAVMQGGQLVKIRRKHRECDDSKLERSRRTRRSASASSNDRSPSPPPRRQLKRIEYKPSSSAAGDRDRDRDAKALVLHRDSQPTVDADDAESRAELFLSYVNKGPESERGCSINKVLKRFHRERCDRYDDGKIEWGGGAKVDEEKELWKSMRLRRNERGEIVLFFGIGA